MMVMSSDKPPQLVNYKHAATIEHCKWAVKINGFPKGHILPIWFISRKIGTILTFEDHVRKFGTHIAYFVPLYGQVQRAKLKTAQDTKVGIAVRVVRLDDFDRNASL